jgi:hypothetical protein
MDLISPSKDIDWQTGLKRKSQQSAAYRRPSHRQKEALTESERLEEDSPGQWPLKTGRSSNTYLGQSRLQMYIYQTR